jgi:tRNA-modifying protein YgfZ
MVLVDVIAEPKGYVELRNECALAPLEGLVCRFLVGADAAAWLQGQATQDIRNMQVGEARETCICAVTGQVQAMLTVAMLADRLAITTDAQGARLLEERLEGTVFTEDVRMEKAPEGWSYRVLQGPQTAALFDELGMGEDVRAFDLFESGGIVSPYRYCEEGAIVWAPPSDSFLKQIESSVEAASQEAVEAVRLENGIPLFGVDFDSRALPPELGEAFLERTVCYAKGCFTGQEVLARIRSKGHVNRTWVALECESPVEPGGRVRSEWRANAGFVTSAALSPEFGPIAAAMLRVETADPGTEVAIEWNEGESNAKVRAMPLRRENSSNATSADGSVPPPAE